MDASTRDLLVVGGGAVGLCAAITAAQLNPQLTALSSASSIRAITTRRPHKAAQEPESERLNFEDHGLALVQVTHSVRIMPIVIGG